ncbi:hypothetical protein M422DRAFT_254806 [Sphaerobolus stellatus SS14]|uniref:FAD-binding domain-containing protein n=1 Tax=Sphaerobolus stellatus (strain SS14) TaxID=990650 RepID=A0A0C9UGD4_SPHS4|nr:hypothetical protein M422DRAFT_254806 [Sphaerobolus stellatus SS14]
MSLPSEVEVLVVGAGPVGLVAAITLKKFGLNIAVVDRDISNRNGSKATVLHIRTLEALETIGMVNIMVEHGVPTNGIRFTGGSNKLFDVDFSLLNEQTAYPFAVMIPQQQVEALLRKKLKEMGSEIIVCPEVTDYFYDDEKKAIRVVLADQSVIWTQYLLGTDGGRSTIRKLANIPFQDPQTGIAYEDKNSLGQTIHFALADVSFEEPLLFARDYPTFCLDPFLVCTPVRPLIPQQTETLCRIVLGTLKHIEVPQSPSKEYLQAELDRRNPFKERLVIKEVFITSRYRVRAALAETYWKKIGNGHVLLAGDAAHVHSPVGGQGMNLGICDAIEVGHAIRDHIEAKRTLSNGSEGSDLDRILQGYAEERRNIGVKVLALAKRLTRMVTWNYGWRRVVRNVVMRVAGFFPSLKKAVAWRVSGLGNGVLRTQRT